MDIVIDYGGLFCIANMLTLGIFKYAFAEKYLFPYMGIAISVAPLAIYGMFIQARALFTYNGRNKLFYLTGPQYFSIACMYAGATLCGLYCLTYDNTSLTRYFVIACATDVIFMPAFSHFILHRPMFLQYIFAAIIAVIAVLVHELCPVYRQLDNPGAQKKAVSENSALYLEQKYYEGFEGPILAMFSRIFWLLACSLSKRMLVSRAFFYKLKSRESFRQPSFLQMHPREDRQRKKKFYQQYFEGEDKPKLLKKDSAINRRFELFRRVERMLAEIKQIEQQNVANVQYKGLQDQKLAIVKRLATQNCVRTNELTLAPTPMQANQRFLRFQADYGFLHPEELDEIMDMDETYINTQIKRGNVLHFSEIKKWELDAMLELEEAQKHLLEVFLGDYHDVKLYAHLFSDHDDMLLTRLDEMFDSLVYDGELFNFDVPRNLELYAFSSLITLIGTIFCAFFNNELYLQIYLKNDNREDIRPSMADNNLWVLFLIAGVFYTLRPFLIARLVKAHRHASYFVLRIVTDFLLLFTASTLTEFFPMIGTTQLIALTLNVLAQYLIYAGAQHTHDWAEFSSLLDLAKTYFVDILEPEQIVMMEIRLIQIFYTLGKDAFQRILVDLLASKNPRALLHTANPVLFVR